MNNPDQDMIDMIAKATPQTEVNEDHREALRRQVLDVYDQREARHAPDHKPLFTFYGATVMKLAASFALLAAIGIFAVTALSPSKAIAFEDVAKEIIKIETASFEIYESVHYPDGRSVDLEPNRVLLKAPDKFRLELSIGGTIVADLKQDKMLVLLNQELFNQEVFNQEKFAMVIQGVFSELNEDQRNAIIFGDIQNHLRQAEQGKKLGDINYEKLEAKKIDGAQAVGFRVLYVSDQEDAEKADDFALIPPLDSLDIWADAETGVILLLEAKTAWPDGTTETSVYKNFVYNQELDMKLLSLDVPEGYTLIDAEQGGVINANVGTEEGGSLEFLIDIVSTYALENNGFYPNTLTSNEIKEQMIASWKKDFPDKPIFRDDGSGEYVDKDLAASISLVDNAFEFIHNLEKDGVKYNYAGKGIKFGDGETPILWFKLKGAESYTVVYGDTEIKHADKAPVKP
ncbi:MAG: LolA family protein [Phycisphaeraceae bacterium]